MKFNSVDCTVQTSSLKNGVNSGIYTLILNDIDWNIDNVKPVDTEGTLTIFVEVNGDNIICSGSLDAVFSFPCARCLKLTPFEVLEEIYREYTVNESSSFTDANIEYVEIKHGVIPIINAIREAIILSIPGKPLCSPDCKGIHYIT